MSSKSISQTENRRHIVPLFCKCKHILGLMIGLELRIGEAAIVRSRTVLVCPNCGRRKQWRPAVEKST